jgi:DNA ligase D-like protein (predicted 3'-phosphoesterase)
MKTKDALKTYRKKRDFKITPEPSGKSAQPASKQPMFVIQKHDATRLHYDFRIEAAGVLKSWAIPKGPSTNPKEKRLAMPTEDHPIAYGDFEGVIPEGEYGGGLVIVWDTGTYRNISDKNGREIRIEDALRQGRAKIWLEGKKVKGGYALTRFGSNPARWLLIKMNDSKADPKRNITEEEPNSVLSGRPIEEIGRRGRKHTRPRKIA